MFATNQFKDHLEPYWQDLKIIYQDQVSSTNDLAKEYLTQETTKPALFLSHHQTKGRGRYGKSFYSKLSHGLYLSLALPMHSLEGNMIDQMTIITASALVETLACYLKEPLAIKWVNDIFYRQRKVAGILTEAALNPQSWEINGLVIGIGMNLAGSFVQTDPALQAVAGTLFGSQLPDNFSQEVFLAQFINRLQALLDKKYPLDYLTIYQDHLMGINQVVSYQIGDQIKHGIIQGINQQGHLVIQRPDQSLETLSSGQVHLGSQQFKDF
ncbi:biotin--[acetyl-CoA-carboxylase] ligase [Facklamia languida]